MPPQAQRDEPSGDDHSSIAAPDPRGDLTLLKSNIN